MPQDESPRKKSLLRREFYRSELRLWMLAPMAMVTWRCGSICEPAAGAWALGQNGGGIYRARIRIAAGGAKAGFAPARGVAPH